MIRNKIGLDDATLVRWQVRADALSNDQGSFDFAKRFAERQKELADALLQNAKVYENTIAEIERDFAGKDRKGESVIDRLVSDLKAAKEAIGKEFPELGAKIDELLGDAEGGLDKAGAMYEKLVEFSKELLKVGPPPFIMTKREVQQLNAEMDYLSKRFVDMLQKADAIRDEIIPEEAFRKALEELQELKRQFPEILDEPVFEEKRRRLESQILKAGSSLQAYGVKLRDTITDFADDAARAWTDVAFGAKVSFGQILMDWTRLLFQMTTREYVTGPLFKLIGAGLGSLFAGGAQPNIGGIGGAPSLAGPSTPTYAAHGGGFFDGAFERFAKGGIAGLIGSTVIFPMRNGRMGKAGEAGPEYAVEPVRMSDGNLGVRAMGGGDVTVNVIDNRSGGERPQVRERTGANGDRIIDILIEEKVKGLFGSGRMDRIMERFGARRQPIPR